MIPQKPTFQKFETFGKLSNNLIKKILFFLIIFIGIACENTSQKSLQKTKDTTDTAKYIINMVAYFYEMPNYTPSNIRNTINSLHLSPQTSQQILEFMLSKLEIKNGMVLVRQEDLATTINDIINSIKNHKKNNTHKAYDAELVLSTNQLTNKEGKEIDRLAIMSVVDKIPSKDETEEKKIIHGHIIEIQVIHTATNIPLLWIDEKELVYLSEHTEMTKEQVKTAIENVFGHKVITEKSTKVTNSNTILAEFGVISLKILSNFKNEKTTLTIQKKVGLYIGVFNFGKPIKELLQKY